MQAIDHASTAEVIADRIRAEIVRGGLKPGGRLIEQELSQAFDVSRGPVREAIRLLAAEGVVVLRKNRGAVVATPTMDDVIEAYALRQALGGVAIAAAAQSGTVGDREAAALLRLVDRLREPRVLADAERVIDADLAFQSALVAHSGLPRFTESFARTDTDIRVFVRALGIRYDAQDYEHIAARHARLVAHVRDGDAEQASALWREHVTATVLEFSRGQDGLERPGLMQVLTDGV